MAKAGVKPPYLDALLASWVPARRIHAQDRIIGITPGGGRRLNSAMLHGDEDRDQLNRLAAAMKSLGAAGVFQSPTQSPADQLLAEMGYTAEAETSYFTMPARTRIRRNEKLEIYTADVPLALMRRFWETHGTNADRQAAMERAQNPVFVMVRAKMALGGLAFVGGEGASRMMHAVIVAPELRQMGVGRSLVSACLTVAHEQGADRLTWLTENSNIAAMEAFARMGGERKAGYCYRLPP